jgi:hypothetical protein
MNWIKRLYTLWKFDRSLNHLFHVWLYLWTRRINGYDPGDMAAYDLVDIVIHDMLLERETM